MLSKACTICGEDKPLTEYGISLLQYEAMLEAQNGVCAICKKTEGKHLSVDHNHVTGEIRGLLCSRCNLVIGRCNDDTKLLKAAILYLGDDV